MCGICGSHGRDASVDAVSVMLRHMEHRGPDGEGSWQAPGIVLGHRRLAIVDLSERGRQPMVSSDGRIAISVNGEIYNYAELRRELEQFGHLFVSDCDSETVIHAWRQWGEECFGRFNGMFAIALWDGDRQALHLVRDRMGIKPIFYWSDGGQTLFASDMRAIVAASGRTEWPISPAGLGQYLTYENRFGAQTMLEGINLVEPGQRVQIDRDGMKTVCFADPSLHDTLDVSFPEAVSGFKSAFGKAVDRHLMSDVPLASYLSAGIDSSLVTLTAAERLADEHGPTAFTGAFDAGGWYDEVSGAAMVAASRNLPHKRVQIGAESFQAHFDDLVFALDEPRMGTGALPQYMVAKDVAKTHKVVLTGHGGDELFSGYPVFKFVLLAQTAWRKPAAFLKALRSVRLSELPHIVYFALATLSGREKPFLPRLFGPALRDRLLRKHVTSALKRLPDTAAEPAPGNVFDRLMRQYLRDYLPGLLILEDKVSMAHSLESRTPFLDNELVAYALSLPTAVKLDGGILKAVPRAAARGVLPDPLFSLPKRGFPNPLSAWLRGPLAGWMRTRLCDTDSTLGTLFEPEALSVHVESYLGSWRRRLRPLDEIATHRIWMLLCLESWIRQYKERLGVTLLPPGAGANNAQAS
ncbi:asparagine synthase (glutamine-hydrolyzing) [uncultured Hoeflea sp.]|uniref:asparagine synthase (glutamine-hydrolyzing) n=1 Tax=uncultured Hoeflea sp. TaxID=538666 RepID=UPI002613F8FE|nr:asparagine synthase (glutamine-hydrolyzing) [uncultured Hoeflea sp.]